MTQRIADYTAGQFLRWFPEFVVERAEYLQGKPDRHTVKLSLLLEDGTRGDKIVEIAGLDESKT